MTSYFGSLLNSTIFVKICLRLLILRRFHRKVIGTVLSLFAGFDDEIETMRQENIV